MRIDPSLARTLAAGGSGTGGVVVVTGSGISAESGIRTYRGDDGLWTVDGVAAMSKATLAYFSRYPERSWRWHLDRRSEALRADPNAAHRALARLEAALGDRFTLITQNVDRLHISAGSSEHRTIEVHGHYGGMRCTSGCPGVLPIPKEFDTWSDESDWVELRDLLVCGRCGFATRPHVLWFDEFYDEEHYRMKTAGSRAARASLLITVGTSGGVPLAARLVGIALRAGATVVDVNPNNNELRSIAEAAPHGHVVDASAADALPSMCNAMFDAVGARGEKRICPVDRSRPGDLGVLEQPRVLENIPDGGSRAERCLDATP